MLLSGDHARVREWRLASAAASARAELKALLRYHFASAARAVGFALF